MTKNCKLTCRYPVSLIEIHSFGRIGVLDRIIKRTRTTYPPCTRFDLGYGEKLSLKELCSQPLGCIVYIIFFFWSKRLQNTCTLPIKRMLRSTEDCPYDMNSHALTRNVYMEVAYRWRERHTIKPGREKRGQARFLSMPTRTTTLIGLPLECLIDNTSMFKCWKRRRYDSWFTNVRSSETSSHSHFNNISHRIERKKEIHLLSKSPTSLKYLFSFKFRKDILKEN